MLKYFKIILFMILILGLLTVSVIIVWKNKLKYSFILKNNFKKLNLSNLLTVNTYNVNYLPFSGNKNFLKNLNTSSDIICLQEYFYHSDKIDLLTKFANKFNFNLIVPEDTAALKILDSGLVFLSKYKIIYYQFNPWKVSNKTDRLANKGFLHVIIDFCNKEFNIINVHLQAVYKENVDTKFKGIGDIRYRQLQQLEDYVTENRILNFMIVGDFNIPPEEVILYNLFKNHSFYHTDEPTIYTNFEDKGKTNCQRLDENYLPNKLDYLITSRNITNHSNIISKCFEESDHKMLYTTLNVN